MSTQIALTHEEQRNRTTLEAFQMAWGKRDVEALGRLISKDCVYSASVGPAPGTTWRGREAVINGFAAMLKNDPGHSSSGDTIYKGNRAFASWRIESGPPHAAITLRGCDLFEFVDGLICRKDAYRKTTGQVLTNVLSPARACPPETDPTIRDGISVRPFCRADVPHLLTLMKDLARFEGYIDDFRVTEQDLITHGLGPAPAFEALVATRLPRDDSSSAASATTILLGMCVLYHIPWTYDMRSKLVMKELYVADHARGRGVGAALLHAARRRARQCNASALIWTVLKGNTRAETFYTKHGGRPDPLWDNWTLKP